MQAAEANDAGGQCVPGVLNHGQAVVADAKPAQALEPADGPLDPPADFPQTAAVRRIPLGYVREVEPSVSQEENIDASLPRRWRRISPPLYRGMFISRRIRSLRERRRICRSSRETPLPKFHQLLH